MMHMMAAWVVKRNSFPRRF